MIGFPGLHSFGVAYYLPQMLQILDVAQSHSLGEQIAHGSAFNGTGDDLTIQRIGNQLIQETVVDRTAYDVQRINALPLHLFQAFQSMAVFQCQGFVNAAGNLTNSLRNRLIGIRAEFLNFLDHVTTGEDTRTSAYRELLEEVGVDLDFTGVRPAVTVAFSDGWDDFYVVNADVDADKLEIQLDEVQAVKWASLEEVLTMRANGEFMPYTRSFLEYLFFRADHTGSHDYEVKK